MMALIILAFLYGAFVIGSPSFITIICMNAVKRYINRYFIYGAMLTLSFVLICYYMYSFLIEKQMDTLINKIGCKMAENEPDFSLGIMDCHTRFNVFFRFLWVSFINSVNCNFSCLDNYAFYAFM